MHKLLVETFSYRGVQCVVQPAQDDFHFWVSWSAYPPVLVNMPKGQDPAVSHLALRNAMRTAIDAWLGCMNG